MTMRAPLPRRTATWSQVAALVFLTACWASCGGAPPETTDGESAVTTIPHRLGFTGASSLPGRDLESARQMLALLGYANGAEFDQAVVAHMKALSAPLARVEFMYVGEGKFVSLGEGLTRDMAAAGFELYGDVNPIPPMESLDSGFEAGLTALVAAHPEIRTWQIGNEPDLLWKDHTKFVPFFARTQPVLRRACPACKILLAGISNQWETGSDSYQRYDAILEGIAAAAGLSGPAFDIFDFHYYKEKPSALEIRGAVRSYRALLEKHGLAGVPFWCTETGIYTGDPEGPEMSLRTEDDQARDLPRLVAWMGEAGVERILFWTLIEGIAGVGISGFFDGMGLVYNGLGWEAGSGPPAGSRKKAYTTFGLLAAALQDTGPATRLADGVYRFDGRARPVYIVWSEQGATSASLTGLAVEKLLVKELVPDAEGRTAEQTVAVQGGAASVPLGAAPSLVVGL